ncbi:MAG: GTP-binding protein [Paludibacteraceae bacterium]|nr:GTP-binding protein [Paludibacteraceae bacterium]
MEEKLWEAIDNLIEKLYMKREMAGISKSIGGLFDTCSQEFLSKRICEIVKRCVSNASWVGLTSAIPGAGSAINATALAGVTWGMYADINSALNISFSENFLKSVSSGICANIASSLAVAGASMIPGVGSVISALGGIVNNRVALYSSAFVYISALSSMVTKGNLSESSFESQIQPIKRVKREYPIVGIVGHTKHGMTSLSKITYSWSLAGVDSKVKYEDFHSYEKTIQGIRDLDGIILVVSAEDGVMPQTYDIMREASLNQVDVIAAYISKSSKIKDEEMLELAEFDIQELGNRFDYQNIPIVRGDSLSAYYKLNHNVKDKWVDAYLHLLRIVNNWEIGNPILDNDGSAFDNTMDLIFREYGQEGFDYAHRYFAYTLGEIDREELNRNVRLSISTTYRIQKLVNDI